MPSYSTAFAGFIIGSSLIFAEWNYARNSASLIEKQVGQPVSRGPVTCTNRWHQGWQGHDPGEGWTFVGSCWGVVVGVISGTWYNLYKHGISTGWISPYCCAILVATYVATSKVAMFSSPNVLEVPWFDRSGDHLIGEITTWNKPSLMARRCKAHKF